MNDKPKQLRFGETIQFRKKLYQVTVTLKGDPYLTRIYRAIKK